MNSIKVLVYMLGVSLGLMAQPVKSIVGARGIGATETGWKNPYVTDGLVAMWDGEWNAGGGVHDASATTWVDLVGGKTISLPSSARVLDNKMTFVEMARSSTITYDTSKPVYSVFHTYRRLNPNQVSQRIFMLLSEGTSSSTGAYSWNNNTPLRVFRGINWQDVVVQDYDAPCEIGNIYSISQDSSSPDNIFAIYVNGVKVYELAGENWRFGYEFGTTGSYTIGATSDSPQDVYNIRLYNRALTAEEIAHNYAVDKARFNLP